MKFLSTELKVGLFTLGAAFVIGYMFFVLSPDTFTKGEKKKFYTIVDNAAGIVVKSQVKTNGVVVGKVQSILLQGNSTRIDFDVDNEVSVPKGSKVAIKEKGLLGDVFMEIIRGPESGVQIEDGGMISPSEDQVNLSVLLDVAGSVGKDIKKLTSTLSAVLGGEDGQKNLDSFVQDIRGAAANMRGILEDNRSDIKILVSDLRKTSSSLQHLVGDKESELSEIISNVRATTKDLKLFASTVRHLMDENNTEKIERIISSFDKTMTDIEGTAKSVRLVAHKIEQGEGTIGKLINDEKTITELEATIKEVRELIAPAAKLRTEVDYRGEFTAEKTSQHYFNVVFKTRPDKFYLLGFTDLGKRVRDTYREDISSSRDESSPDSISPPSKGREVIVDRGAIRFNAQVGKRWHNAQVRFGLFETTGGLGGDVYFFRDKVKLSLEAFDWDSKSYVRKTAHVKSYLSILFFNHVYGIVGVDDWTRIYPSKQPQFFMGGGLNFDDDDLKAVFGAASLMR